MNQNNVTDGVYKSIMILLIRGRKVMGFSISTSLGIFYSCTRLRFHHLGLSHRPGIHKHKAYVSLFPFVQLCHLPLFISPHVRGSPQILLMHASRTIFRYGLASDFREATTEIQEHCCRFQAISTALVPIAGVDWHVYLRKLTEVVLFGCTTFPPQECLFRVRVLRP